MVLGLCSVEDVKMRLGIPPEDTSYDDEIELLIEEASEIAIVMLGQEWPGPEDTPRLVRHATANIAAGLFKRLRGPSSEDSPLFKLGLDELDIYKRSAGSVTRT